MLAALSMSQVGAVILVDGEAETAFEGADMVFEEVGVFVEVDGFEGEFAESFASVSVCRGMRGDSSTAKFGPGSVLVLRCQLYSCIRVRMVGYLVIHGDLLFTERFLTRPAGERQGFPRGNTGYLA